MNIVCIMFAAEWAPWVTPRIHKFIKESCQKVSQHELDFAKETSSAPHKMEVQQYCHTKESPVKCTRLSALTAATSAKCLLSQIRADQSTAGNVGQREEAERVVEDDTRKQGFSATH